LFNVISIKQRYAGHAKQAALQMSQCEEGASMGRFIIVVDEDIDPSNLEEVIWAICTRCDPETAIDILRRCRGSFLDPVFNKKGAVPFNGLNSRAIIEATKPFEWINDFPQSVKISPETRNELEKKWGNLFK
jgi:UbiD family decarboxylase